MTRTDNYRAQIIATAQAIADVIVGITRSWGACTRADLTESGFSQAQLDAAYPMASGLAAVMLAQSAAGRVH
ncbi:MAG: hypothetical protein WBK91_03955 [Alphaproteobacteria bacterium]